MTFISLPRKATYSKRINFLSDEYFNLNVDMFLNVTKIADFRHASCENLSLQGVRALLLHPICFEDSVSPLYSQL